MQPKALAAGYVVVDHTAALATHLSEIIKQNSYELLTRHETKRLIDLAGEAHPKLVEELIPKLMTLGEVQRILQQLLREQVSIRDLGTILETLVEAAAINKNPVLLVEAVRHSLGRALVRPLLNDKGELKVVTLDRGIEEECIRALTPQTQMVNPMALQPSTARRVIDGLRSLLGEQGLGAPPVILCSSPGRFYLRRLLEPFLPKIVVLAPTEIPAIVPVQSIGAVR
jgi:flagellar biosynthesis protein FlhA